MNAIQSTSAARHLFVRNYLGDGFAATPDALTVLPQGTRAVSAVERARLLAMREAGYQRRESLRF